MEIDGNGDSQKKARHISSSMNPGNKLFLTSNGIVRSGLIVPIRGNTIYRGDIEAIATRNPFMKFDSIPRNEHSSLGLTTIDSTMNTVIAISKSRT